MPVIQEYVGQLRRFDRDVRLYLIISTLIGFAILPGIPAVLLSLYLVRLDYSLEFIGLLNGISGLAFALSCLPAGAVVFCLGSRHRPEKLAT